MNILLAAACLFAAPADPTVLKVTQEGEGRYVGDDERPILAALNDLAGKPGVIELAPGAYTLRQSLRPHAGVTLRGAPGTILRLPPPAVVVEAAAAGATALAVDDSGGFVPGGEVQVVLQDGKRRVEGDSRDFPCVRIARVGPGRVELAAPLPCEVPLESGVGYRHNLIELRGSIRGVRIEGIAFDGGRRADAPMPGHAERCGVFAEGPYSYAKGPTAAAVEGLVVRDCVFRDFYGRAVALYSVVRAEIVDCHIDRIDDEAIDLDHFARHCRVTGNTIRRAETGVTINDGSYNVVRDNRIEECGVGVHVWWWHMCPQPDVDVENEIAGNTIMRSRGAAISLGKRCHRNRVLDNRVDGKIVVVEADNELRGNE